MLYPVNDYMLYIIRKEMTKKYLREAEVDHLLDEINPQAPRRLLPDLRQLVRVLGHVLVFIGQRLDRVEISSI
jgi:hypothetical protein